MEGPPEVSSPRTSVVTPWRILLWASPSSSKGRSECECMSMKPGATTRPRASIVRRAGASGGDPADRGDPVAADGHVAEEPGIARAVDDLAAADHEVERLGRGLAAPPDSATTAQEVAGIEMNWCLPCGSPLSKKTCTGLARVSTFHEPSSCRVSSRNRTPRGRPGGRREAGGVEPARVWPVA